MNTTMGTVIKVLLDTTLGLSVEEKFFLTKLLLAYDGDVLLKGGVIHHTVGELEGILKIGDYLIKKTRDSLLEKRLLKNVQVAAKSSTKRGRPRTAFSISTQLIDMLSNAPKLAEPLVHSERIEKLLLRANSQKNKDLTPTTSVLLAVLYAQANSCGAIYNLGIMDLAKLSGLKTRGRTEEQLQKLFRLGFILDRVSGISRKYFFGKVKGEIFMDVMKDEFCEGLILPRMVLLSYQFNSDYTHMWAVDKLFGFNAPNLKVKEKTLDLNYVFEIDRILRMIESKVNDTVFFNNIAWRPSLQMPNLTWCSYLTYEANIVSDFVDFYLLKFILYTEFNTVELRRLIQYKIHYYASKLLSECWDKIENKFVILEPLFSQLSNELITEANKKNILELCRYYLQENYTLQNGAQADKFMADGIVDIFNITIYRLAYESALLTKGLLEWLYSEQSVDFAKANYCILSKGYRVGYKMKDFGVIVHFESERPKTKHISVNVERDEAKIKKYEDLSFLSEHGDEHDFYLKKSY